ncbi:MAG: phospholipase [Bacteroidota bacterium]
MPAITVVFVHGWSVTNLDTYGNLPGRLRDEGRKAGINIDVREIFLGRYISFHDEVRLPDISRAFKTALADQLTNISSFVCITHSTGGPVIRDWWNRYCKGKKTKCSMSHVVMLAPANFGSALALLGKETLSRLKSWWNNIEPGQGVLDWLALGSVEAWDLNLDWILSDGSQIGPAGFFPFVLTGQSIDRKFYDTLNSYTGEIGSDGVVRVAAANLESTYIRLEQPLPQKDARGKLITDDLRLAKSVAAPPTALRVISKRSHSGKAMGIMFSVGANDEKSMETINAIFDCILVKTKDDYEVVMAKFKSETETVQEQEKVEIEERLLLSDRYFIHDRYTMIIFRVRDSEGYPVNDFDLLLTAGEANDPNHLPEGFFADRQQNKSSRNIITYFLNYDILEGTLAIVAGNGKVIREQTPGINMLGIKIVPRPVEGFIKYIECSYVASKSLFNKALNPNSTTMIDIVLQRVVDKEVFRMEPLTNARNFSAIRPSNELAE